MKPSVLFVPWIKIVSAAAERKSTEVAVGVEMSKLPLKSEKLTVTVTPVNVPSPVLNLLKVKLNGVLLPLAVAVFV